VSQIMVDKPYTAPAEKVGKCFGRVDDRTLREIDRVLTVFLGIA
jgi:mRNA-degrading endonuclease toxin of MazEF toxin-antitoxin module